MAQAWSAPGYYDGVILRFPFIRDGADVRPAGPRSWRWICRECEHYGESWERVQVNDQESTPREDRAEAYRLLEIMARKHVMMNHQRSSLAAAYQVHGDPPCCESRA